jgi:hypothetical protein
MFHGVWQERIYNKATGVQEIYEEGNRSLLLPALWIYKVFSWHVQFLLGSLFQSMDVTKLL